MTREAKRLGMSHTLFVNASGLSNPAHVTTARDIALLASALIHHSRSAIAISARPVSSSERAATSTTIICSAR
jgi:D-alanyl-D-alanine carboxypeptidase (penicillin-binding protein 5/6)